MYAINSAVAEAIFLRAMLRFILETEVKIHLWTDSTTSLGIISRRGSGHLKHVDVKFLWLQDAVRSQQIYLYHLPGEYNVADMFTKGLDPNKMRRFSEALGYR